MLIHNKRHKMFALFTVAQRMKKKNKKQKRTRRRKREIMCCDHVNKCFKYSIINLNKVANKFRFTNESLTIPGIS